MQILTLNLTKHLPEILSIESNDPMLRVKLILPNSNRAWYVIGWKSTEKEVALYALESSHHYSDGERVFEELPFSFFEKVGKAIKSEVIVDTTFIPVRLSQIEDESLFVNIGEMDCNKIKQPHR